VRVVDLALSDDQEALRRAVRDFFEKESPPEVVRDAEPLGFDGALWRKVTGLGLAAIAVPEERGGGGAGFVELAVAAELLGRSLAPVPLVEAAVATTLLAALPPSPGLDPLVAGAVAGDLLPTLALAPVRAGGAGAGGTAGGVARLVPAGAVADLVVALRGDELVAVRRPAPPGAAPANLGAMPVADVPLGEGDGADTLVLATGPDAVAAHARAVGHWQALTAVALLGVGTRAFELGLDYVRQRRAFGVLVGAFQSIQHRLADDATALEGARLIAYEAAWAHDAGLAEAPTLATMALLFTSEVAFAAASAALHVHGGYGYALEYDVQLYFRRAKAWPLVAGDPRAAYAGVAHRLFAPTEA